MKFIPDDINIDFMGARKKAFMLSGVLVTICLVLIASFGLNQGIDFRGGSAVIASFKAGGIQDRSELEASMRTFLDAELGKGATQVTVQDFDTGAGNTVAGVDVDRFRIYTEITSLISIEKRDAIVAKLKGALGEKTRAETRGENTDTFYITVREPTAIAEMTTQLNGLFGELGYPQLTIVSGLERQEEIRCYQDVGLLLQDQEAAAEEAVEGEGEGAAAVSGQAQMEECLARVRDQIAGKNDTSFTVQVEALRAKVTERLAADFPGVFVQVESSTSVSPSVGKDLLNNGLLAILYALIGILIYITVRFDFRFAPGAVVALLHDVIITIGLFALFQVKFSLPIIAALLTIVGYSLNDTIVVLDRVRETFEVYRGRGLVEMLNRAINGTLSRTVLTSLTTMFVVVAVLIFGGGQIRDFAWALFIGIIVGTYSSIFIASPLVYYMDQYLTRREAQSKSTNKGDNAPKGDKSARRAKASA